MSRRYNLYGGRSPAMGSLENRATLSNPPTVRLKPNSSIPRHFDSHSGSCIFNAHLPPGVTLVLLKLRFTLLLESKNRTDKIWVCFILAFPAVF